jgi:hypothetical protein
LIGKAVLAETGERSEKTCTWWMLRGLPDVDGVGAETVLDIEPAGTVLARGESLGGVIRVASPAPLPACEAVLRLGDGEAVRAPVPAAGAGAASEVTVSLPVEAADGALRLTVDIVGDGGASRVVASVAVVVATERLRALAERLEAAAGIVEAEAPAPDSPPEAARRALVRSLLGDAEKALAARDLEAATAALDELDGLITK